MGCRCLVQTHAAAAGVLIRRLAAARAAARARRSPDRRREQTLMAAPHPPQASFIGAIAVADLVKSTLGPKGMDKILQVRPWQLAAAEQQQQPRWLAAVTCQRLGC